ncbi:MAG TPA: helix-turn-helix transcriptional regulator, partial [Oscillospiraceae bacterium]|nr:helix-turn-helix transcriptional regulator [Oscillospiraceae bacterium]
YMSKLIKNNTGMNLTEILTSLKMENSKKLLSSTNMSIFQIAECNGYESPDHFSRTFKKTYGISPRQYRKICMNHELN